ncbi:NAD(P)-dependent oxidoreductase [bacterium]|jgi:nucleoside-diphosphate-sugar epimerase|nr:NAD(P)-dependent oxidoreductase [bacterium]
MSSVLILGASGFLGQALIRQFNSNGCKVGAISRNADGLDNNLTDNYCENILNHNQIDKIISEYDVVINCTGQVTRPINQCLTLNTTGIHNIINSIKNHKKKLIHISSVSVYGSLLRATEDSQLNPESVYASIKCFSEYLINSKLDNYIILRVSNLYGDSQKKGLIYYLSSRYLSNESALKFNNNGELRRFYLDVDDLAKNIDTMVSKNDLHGVFNLIGPCQYTIKELVSKFENILNYRFNVQYKNVKPIENIYNISNTKISSTINLVYRNSIDKYINDLKK